MKVLMIHVGNQIPQNITVDVDKYLLRKSLLTGKEQYYRKHDIINADRQMQSLIHAGVEIEYGHLSHRKSVFKIIRAGMRIRSLCKSFKPDLVHVLWGSSTSLVTVLFSNKPVIISFCGSDLLGTYNSNGQKTISGRLNTFLSQISALLASGIITKTEHLKQSLWQVSQKKTRVIPNGVDLGHFPLIDKSEARKKVRWPENAPIILFFGGNGQIVKNKTLAMQIFELAKQQIPGLIFEDLYDVPHELMHYYYNAADVMLLTSFHEGSNNSVKEAMACNLPVISVDVGDSGEHLKEIENSFVVENYDPLLLAEKVVSVVKSQKRSNGKAYVKLLSEENIAQSIFQFYKKIIPS